ncbi:MAG: rSAM/selenodomain-associated transferase 1 [Crocinitomix sp.]
MGAVAQQRKSAVLMQKNLLIVFAKNKLFGKVKTRLAKTIGDQAAFEVYETLFHITERESCAVSNADVHVHYSHHIDEEAWVNCPKHVQIGESLGDRMKNAFEASQQLGYSNIIGIGADLPEIKHEIIEQGFDALNENDFVFGPAEDGGYYMVGMSKSAGKYIFENKPWSTTELLEVTKAEIAEKGDSVKFFQVLNDIDTIEDLEKSTISGEFLTLIQKAKANK